MTKHDDFLTECLEIWIRAIERLALPSPNKSAVWRDIDDVCTALQPFMGNGRNHAHYPSGGGLGFLAVQRASEPGCLQFTVAEQLAEIMKPKELIFEYFPDDPIQSFFMLELAELSSTGIDPNPGPDREQIFEYPEGKYLSPEIWYREYLAHDEHGREIPLPPEGRLISRWFRGKVLIVGKGSLWNGVPATYDGRHNKMTAAQVRGLIERGLSSTR